MKESGLRVVGIESLRAVVDHAVAYDAVLAALKALAANEIDVPEELALKLRNDGEVHIKGGWLASQPYVVFKVATGAFPNGTNSGCSILLDALSGQPAVIFDDGGWLTEMRTAAAGAVAADLLAVDGPLAVAILGTGFQARYQLAALRDRRDLRAVRVWGRSPAKTREFAEEMAAQPCDSVADAVAEADVIVTATSARSPILRAEHLRPGVHVTAMGADMVGKRELAADVFDLADIVVADDRATCSRVGELQHVPQHVERAIDLAALAQSASDEDSRRSTADISVADLCGLGAYDAAIAASAWALVAPPTRL